MAVSRSWRWVVEVVVIAGFVLVAVVMGHAMTSPGPGPRPSGVAPGPAPRPPGWHQDTSSR